MEKGVYMCACLYFYVFLNYYLRVIQSFTSMLRKYFDEYDSEEDENYEPTAKENKMYELEHQKRKGGKRNAATSSHQLYQQLKNSYLESQSKKSLQKSLPPNIPTIQLAHSILNSQSIKPNKRIIFAGKQYILNEQTGQLETIQRKNPIQSIESLPNQLDQQAYEIKTRHISYQYLNHVMQAIYNRSKKINAIGKSKLDWKGFVRQEGIEDKLHYNRKGGVIQNMEFIRNTN